MYNLDPNPVLLPHQIKILKTFFAAEVSQTFFLTGGTALAAFYFGHRESEDFDLFSIEQFLMPEVERVIQDIAQATDATVSVKVTSNTYKEIYLENQRQDWAQRLDIVREQPRHFGEIVVVNGVRVDSLENIGSNKILTLFSRLEPKDYIDFYTIISKSSLTFETLFSLAKQKDTGLFEFYFANSIANVDAITKWPQVKGRFDFDAMKEYYRTLSRDLLLRIKPEQTRSS